MSGVSTTRPEIREVKGFSQEKDLFEFQSHYFVLKVFKFESREKSTLRKSFLVTNSSREKRLKDYL